MRIIPLLVSRLFMALPLIGTGLAALPSGVFVMESKDGSHEARVEFTGGEEAYLWSGRRLIRGTATEAEGVIRLKLSADIAGGKVNVMTFQASGESWLDQDQDRWVPREKVIATDPGWTPVEIGVNDATGRAIKDFTYRYRIESAGLEWDPLLVRPLKTEDGKIWVMAPAECEIRLEIDHPDRIRGYGTLRSTVREAGKAAWNVELELGHKVGGKVVNDATGEPLAGAVVSPSIFTPPLFTPDRERSVTTGKDGRFELRGVGSCGVVVEHPEFLEQEVFLDEKQVGEELDLELRLKAGETIRGVVRDPSGKVLAGVKVEDGTGKTVTTGDDGTFVLRGLSKWSGNEWSLTFSKDGFGEHRFHEAEVDGTQGLEIALKPLPQFRGRVVMSDGTPAGKFRLTCGPGSNPSEFECTTVEVTDPEGRFVIQPEQFAEQGDRYWMGVRAEGAAPWDAVVAGADLENGGFRVDLLPGVSLTAKLVLPDSAGGPLEARLEPRDRQPEEKVIVTDHPGKELASYRMSLAKGQEFRFSHLRAGDYKLRIHGKGASPVIREFTVKEADLDLGELKFAGTGSISGSVSDPYDPRKPWSFAEGKIHVEGFGDGFLRSYLRFKTDAAGKFRVEGVPVGTVKVVFHYNVSADIIDAMESEVKVEEGKETEVRVKPSE
jgi:Carboxypeptidase regulatory-like domain